MTSTDLAPKVLLLLFGVKQLATKYMDWGYMQLIVVWPCFTQSDKGVVDFDVVAYFPKEMSIGVYTYLTFIYIYSILYVCSLYNNILSYIPTQNPFQKNYIQNIPINPMALWPYLRPFWVFLLKLWPNCQVMRRSTIGTSHGLPGKRLGAAACRWDSTNSNHGNSNESEYDPCDARNGWIFNKEHFDVIFLQALCFFLGGGRFIDKDVLRKQKKGERKRCSDVCFCLEIGWFYSCFLIGFYSRTSANIIFFTWGWHKKSRNTTKKYHGIWGCCGETPIGAQPSLTWSCIFRKFLAGEGLSRNLAWTCYFASWNEHF